MDDAIDFAALFDEFDTFVMGRKTWDVSAPTEFADMFGGKNVIVFSKTLQAPRVPACGSSAHRPPKPFAS